MLAFTLTAFLELMDHGIVSWDMVSITFIKQVSLGKEGEWMLFFFCALTQLPGPAKWLLEVEYELIAQCDMVPSQLSESYSPYFVSFTTRLAGWASVVDLMVHLVLDCRICQSAYGRCLHPPTIPSHSRKYGVEQSDSVSEDSRRDHCGAAHLSSASVSTHQTMVWSKSIFWISVNLQIYTFIFKTYKDAIFKVLLIWCLTWNWGFLMFKFSVTQWKKEKNWVEPKCWGWKAVPYIWVILPH